MATLTYGIPGAPEGTYGTMPAADLTDTQTFGSWGAGLCVILLVQKSSGDLFCGHMSSGISGAPGNEQTVINGATALLNEALGAAEQGQPWSMCTAGTDSTSLWMREAMSNWFTSVCISDTTNCTDSFFLQQGNETAFRVSNSYTGATNEVANFPFNIEPPH